jgi:hypothetical protein
MSIRPPVRIGAIVEFGQGEVGTVEQINFTYIAVRLWDDRRQIVPVTRVTTAPFENWTRVGLDLLVPVEILVDHATPIETLRAGFHEVCKRSELWDERQWRVDVLEITDKAVRVRGMASVALATQANDLRFELREGWLVFVQQLDGGKYLPHGRVVSPSPAAQPSEDQTADAGPISTTPDSSSTRFPSKP